MKIPVRMFFLLVSIIFIITSNGSTDTIRMMADDWCPYNCQPDTKAPGYMIEIAQKIFSKAHHTVSYKIHPWLWSIKLCRRGDIDAVPGATVKELPDFVFPEECLGISKVYFFVRKGFSWRYNGVDSLKQVKVGIQANYEYSPRLDAYFKEHKAGPLVHMLHVKEPLKINIMKLLDKKIDVIPEDKSVFLNQAKNLGFALKVQEAGTEQLITKEDFESIKVYLAFSPKNPHSKTYANMITQGIREMRASGELQTILAEYGLTDWQPEIEKIKKELELK